MSEIFLLNSNKKISIKKILKLTGEFDSFKFQDIPDYDVDFDNYSDERKKINNYEENNERLDMDEELLEYPLSVVGAVRIWKKNCIRGFEVFYDRFSSNYGVRTFSPCARKDWEEAIKYIIKF